MTGDGEPSALASLRRAASYLLHVLLGVGGVVGVTGLAWPGVAKAELAVRLAPMIVGAVLGVALAEHARRTGKLLRRR